MSGAVRPLPGFDPYRVSWEGPDQVAGEYCSYCGDAIPEDAAPLVMWNEEGWAARFCDHCQAAWFGIETFPDPPDDEPDGDCPDLGVCCLCEARQASTLIMLERRCAVPGHGWACFACGLPPDGASAVLCRVCTEIYETDPERLQLACRGYPASDGRIPIAELPPERFDHDEAKHREFPT